MKHKVWTGTLGVLVLVAATLVSGVGPAPAASTVTGRSSLSHFKPRYSNNLDAAAAAMPTLANPVVADNAAVTARTRSADAKAVASSTATSNCDGCNATSTVFQVADFRGNGAAADNTAAAWSSCVGCASSAVSVQLVIARDAVPLVVNNRALALNVECEECITTAAAIQFVIVGGTRRELSKQAKALIAEIQAELADRLAPPASSQARALPAPEAKVAVDDTAARLAQIILSDVGATSVQRNIDVSTGQ